MSPLSYEIDLCFDEVLKCQWIKVEELAHSQEATSLTHLISKLLIQAKDEGFKQFDIGVHEMMMNIPQYSGSKSFKLFMRSS